MGRKLVFAGLGIQFENTYKALISILNESPSYYIDNNPQKNGKEIGGIRISSVSDLPKDCEYDIYIFSRSFDVISKQIKLSNIKANCYYVSITKGPSAIIGTPLIRNHEESNGEDLKINGEQINLRNKSALITGASRGIGREIARSLAKRGCNLILQARDKNLLADVVRDCEGYGVIATPYYVDLDNLDSVRQWLTTLDKESIDIIYNNAGISPENRMPSQFDVSEDDFYKSYTVNTIVPMIISSYFIGGMMKRNYGRIVNLSTNIQNNIWSIAYACSKSALDKLSSELALAVKGFDIAVSTIDPGAVRTDMSKGIGSFQVDSVIPGALLGIFGKFVSGRNLVAQDYSGLSLVEALNKYNFMYGQHED
jgi:3-oxoacyl-[acyl-carrier protein] reductase